MPDLTQQLQWIAHEEEEKQAQALARRYGLGYVNLLGYPALFNVIEIIPYETMVNFRLVSYLKTGKTVQMATVDPANPSLKLTIDKLTTDTGNQFVLSVCSQSSFLYMLSLYQDFLSKKPKEEKIQVAQRAGETREAEILSLQKLKDTIAQVPTTQLLEKIMEGGVHTDASDVHLEPQEQYFRLRYRIDGVLQDIASIPIDSYKALLSRIKFLAKMKLDVKDHPQDGRFDIMAGNQPVDVRVSTMPTSAGELVEMRILPREKAFIKLEDLGFREDVLKEIEEAIHSPQGMIFNTGPTGSGKTTTLYAILQKLNKPASKIMTLEDPIEYQISGIDQSQVEPEKNYTFAEGLRAILRQDPDVIMVGEMRDPETASISLQAALTGHLVLTTLHANNAPASLPRLLDMGIASYLLAGSINLIIAQRLVRRVCTVCKGKGCQSCSFLGYRGRIAIAEYLKISPKMGKLINQKGSLADFYNLAKTEGMKTMYEDGMDKVKAGITTQQEITRVARE